MRSSVQIIQHPGKCSPHLFIVQYTYMRCIESISFVCAKLDAVLQLTLQGDGAVTAVTRFVTKEQVKRNFPGRPSPIELFEKGTALSGSPDILFHVKQ